MKEDRLSQAKAWLDGQMEAGPRGLRMYLRQVQAAWNWVPPEVLDLAAAHFNMKRHEVAEAAGLQPEISLEPQGETVVLVCRGMACSDAHSADVLEAAEKCLGIKAGETSSDGEFTLKKHFCFGRCAIGPNVKVNQDFLSNQEPGSITQELGNIKKSSI